MKPLDLLIPTHEILATKVPADLCVSGLTQSSRQVVPGSVFFAVRGSRSDGHAFVTSALEQGAAAVVVEDRGIYEEAPRAILVRSTREALSKAGARWHGEPTRAMKVVGVTGTNGKTTTTYLMKSVWESLGIPCGLIGTVEYHFAGKSEPSTLTTPDALQLQALFARMAQSGATHAAVEVSSIALDQSRVGGCRFEVALFTNLTQDHLDYHRDLESYFEAKRKLFRDYEVGHAVINKDDPWGRRLLEETGPGATVSFSLSDPKADFFAISARFNARGSQACVQTPYGEVALETPLIGRYNLSNCLGVLGCAHALGHDPAVVLRALASARGAPGRLERVMDGESYPSIFVDYAHTDDALLNVLTALVQLREKGGGKLITVFGCGGDRDKGKRPKMARVASELSDITIATSDNPRTENPDRILDDVEQGIDRKRTLYYREVNRRRAIHQALQLAKVDDIVLVAGKGHETYQILGTEYFPFDDRQVVRDYYRECTPG